MDIHCFFFREELDAVIPMISPDLFLLQQNHEMNATIANAAPIYVVTVAMTNAFDFFVFVELIGTTQSIE